MIHNLVQEIWKQVSMKGPWWGNYQLSNESVQEYWRNNRHFVCLGAHTCLKMLNIWLIFRKDTVFGLKIINWPTHPISLSAKPPKKKPGERESLKTASITSTDMGKKISDAVTAWGDGGTYCPRPWLRLFSPQTDRGTECMIGGAEAAASPPLLILQTRKASATQRWTMSPSRTVGNIYTQ